MASTIEKLFLQIFERKLSIFQQVKHQADLFDNRLASKCLLDGSNPPPWLLSPSISSLPNEFNKEELMSGLLVPRPQSANPYSSSGYSVQPATTANNSGLHAELHLVDKSFDAADMLSVSSHFPVIDDDVQCNLDTVPEMDVSVTSPQVAGLSDSVPDHSQSLARIQRSKSRQKALEFRNSVKTGKTCSRAENNVGPCTSRFTGSGFTSLQFDHVDQSEMVKLFEASNRSCAVQEAEIGESMVKENSSDVYHGRSTRSRQKASSVIESGVVCNSTYIAKKEDLVESISKQLPDHFDELAELPVVGHVSSEAQNNGGEHRGNEIASIIYSGELPSCKSSSPLPNSIKQPLDVDNSSYIDNKYSRLGVSIDGSSLQPNCVNEISELAKSSSVIFNESCGRMIAKVSDKWSKEKGSDVYSGRITRSRSSSQQADCVNESLKLDGCYGDAEEEPKQLCNPVDDFRELVKPLNITDESCGVNEKMLDCQSTEERNDDYYGKITRFKLSNQQLMVDGHPKVYTLSNIEKDYDRSLTQSFGRSSEPHQPLNLVREEGVDLQEVLDTQTNALPCIEIKNMVDLGMFDAAIGEIDTDSFGLVEACSVTPRSNSNGSSLRMEVSASRPATDCAMPVNPKQLDFVDVEDCSLNEIAAPASENKQESLSSEGQASILPHPTCILDKASVDYQEKPISSTEMPLLGDHELFSKDKKPWNDSSEAFVNETALLVDENTTNSVHQKINLANTQNRNGDCYIMGSWPQHKRRKIAGQLITSFYSSSSLIRKPFQPFVLDHANGNTNAIENPDTVQISERFHMSLMRDDMQPNAIKNSVEDIHQNSGPDLAGPEFSSPKLLVEEVEPGLEGRSRSADKCGARSPSSLTKPSTGVSQGNSLEKVPAVKSTIVIFDERGQHAAEKNQVSLQLEDRFELGSAELLTCTETTMLERKCHLGRNGKSPSSSVSSPHRQSMDLLGSDQSMPVYEWFGMETEGIDFDKLDLSDNALESAIAVERLCKSVCLETPLSHFSTAYDKHKTLNIYQPVPIRVLEGMELTTTINTNSKTGQQLEANSNCLSDEVNDTLLERLHSDSPEFSNAPSTWDVRKPYMSPVGKLWEGITLKSGSSEKRASSIPDLPSIREENENTIEVPETFQDGIGSEQMVSSVKREPLADITKSYNPSISVYESEIVSDRCSLASVNTEFSVTGTCGRDKLKHENQRGNRRKYNSKAKEIRSILGSNGVKRAKESHDNRSSKPILSRKTSSRKGCPSLAEESKHNNIVSNIASFIPLVQPKQAAATVTGKRDVKVKALEAAEVAKRLTEKKENERKTRKEALKLERAKMEEQNLRQLELEKEKKEEERKRKEADMAAKKKQREEEGKKERERKRKRIEEAKRQQQLAHEEKLRAEREKKVKKRRTADEKAFENKESKDKSGKHDKMEKVKGDNYLQKVPETEPVASRVSTIDDGKSSIISESCVALGNCDNNSKEMTVFYKAAENGNLMSNISQEQSYEISPYKGSDDEDEDEDNENDDAENNKFIPQWASKKHLALIVSSQQSIDPQTIFSPESFPNIAEALLPRKLQQKQQAQQ